MHPVNTESDEPERGMPNTLSFLTQLKEMAACIAIRPSMIETIELPHGTCVLAYAANKNVYIFTGPLSLAETRMLMSRPFVDMDSARFKCQTVEQIGLGFHDMHGLNPNFLQHHDKLLAQEHYKQKEETT